MNSATITFTAEEANQLMQFIDMAVRANGATTAKSAAYFIEKITKAFVPEAIDIPEVRKSKVGE